VRLPAGFVSRPATWDDLDAVVTLVKACDLADAGVEDPVREHLEEDWRTAPGELDRRTLLAFAPGGDLAGLAQVFGFNPELSLDAWVRVHPEHRRRGLGAGLLEWTESRARSLVPEGARSKLVNSIPVEDRAGERLLVRRGYAPVRIFWHMERELAGPVEPARIPDGIRIRRYRAEDDADALYDTIEEAFTDHWGHEPHPREEYRERFERLDHGLVWVALEAREMVGALIARTIEGGSGWIDDLGVRRPWRGRGIGRALLLEAFAELARRGTATVALNVDSASRTGATRVYESVGMRMRRAWNLYEKPLPADVS